MEKHDEQFEAFLRQFQLRKPSPLPEMVSLKRRSRVRWILAAAAALVAALSLSTVFVRNHRNETGPHATVEAAGNPSFYKVGESIDAGRMVRSNSAQGVVLSLQDGSHVELRSQTALQLESADDGLRIRLNEGGIVVTAAKQQSGHLYVQTRDAMVSVVGTVFFVSAEQAGTRVAVIEGEVHVQRGSELKALRPGELMATDPSAKSSAIAEEISWSRNAAQYMAMLPQAGPLSLPTAQEAQNGGIPEGPSSIPPSSALPFNVQASYIGNTTEIRTLITVQIMTKDLAFKDVGGAPSASAQITGVIYRVDNRRAGGFSYPLLIPFPSQKALHESLDSPQLFQNTQYLTPGKYKLHLTIEDKNSANVGATDYLLTVPRVPEQSLQASSMILAYSISDLPSRTLGNDMFAIGEKQVKPSVTGSFRQDQSLNVWQEVYGLELAPNTQKPSATFELRISQNNRETIKLLSESSELQGDRLKLQYRSTFSLADFVPGQYEVQLKVTDNLARQSVVTTSKLFVLAGLTQQPQSPAQPSQPAQSREGQGEQIFHIVCTTCHDAKAVFSSGYATRNAYESLVARERNKGARISDAEVPLLVDYLFNTFGKRTEPLTPSDLPVSGPR